jgi:uncharacterized membrane protein YhaH (DUF805 family)
MEWYVTVLKKYAQFTGRARRKEYWMFTLISMIVGFALGIADAVLGLPSVLSLLYAFAVLVPSVAVSVRRLHDTDRSGWMLLLALIPLVGAIIILVFAAQDGTPGDNRFGPNPKEQPVMAMPDA